VGPPRSSAVGRSTAHGRRRGGRAATPALVLALWVVLAVGALGPTGARAAQPAAAQPAPAAQPGPDTDRPLHLRPDGHVALAWLYGGSSADYRAQMDAARGLSVISPTWWYLDTDRPGELELATDDALTADAHARGIAVWPLFGNHIDPDVTDQVLRDPALRQRIVDGIVAEVRRSGVDGVNVDFENLHDDTRFLLTDLVAELEVALPDLVVSVDVTAQTDTWVLGNWSTAFDREGLGRVADYVMLMAYDQHNSLRRNGPVAGLQWVAESTEFLLRTVPAHKVVLGLPFYSRDWADDADAEQGVALDATLGMAAMAGRLAERSQGVTYDAVAGQDLHTYVDGEGRTHRVWLEDVASLQRKTDLVSAHGLAGIAAWRAGFEPPDVWTALDAQLAAAPPPGTASAAAAGQAGPAPAATTQPTAEGPPPGPAGAATPATGPSPAAPVAPGTSSAAPSPGAAPPTAAPQGTADGTLADGTLADGTLAAGPGGGGPRGPWLSLAAALLVVVGVAVTRTIRARPPDGT
jgi:spore germination protein YaaH